MRVRKLNPSGWTTRRAGAAALLTAVAVALLVWLVAVPATRVQAATFTVNVATDNADLNPGDGICDSDAAAGSQCSLRAAIEEADASPAQDVIPIGVAGPIVLTGALPTITDDDLVITGSGQQISFTVPGTAFDIDADGVQMSNLDIDGANVGTIGITISGATDDLILDSLTVRRFTGGGFAPSASGGQRDTIRNCTFSDNGTLGIAFGGANDVVRDSVITGNGIGIAVSDDDYFLVQGNTFSGNSVAQIAVLGMLAGQHMSIMQNTITAGSDGIVVGPGVDATAHIDIGLSVDNRNVFRGTIAAPAEQYLRNMSGANINAIYNDWNAYTDAAIEGVICHDADPACGPGVVNFDPFIATPSPLPTVTATPTPTETPGGATATPTVTATTTPGGVETLPLIAGCNPVAWTGSDATPIDTIASAVAPSGILVALWEFEAGTWLGYSPQFPEVSDLTQKNRLDVVFICTSAGGTFSRPLI
jgi:parallel beta-helix repeat protein